MGGREGAARRSLVADFDIVRFQELRLTEADLEALTDLQRAIYAVLSFAISELNTLAKLYVFVARETSDKKAIEAAINIRRQTIIRTWSAKVFEACEFVSTLPQYSADENDQYQVFRTNAIYRVRLLKEQEGYTVLRAIRHEASNHYSLKAALKSVRAPKASRDASIYIHLLDGNSFFGYGEEVLFFERLERLHVNLGLREDDERSIIDIWMQWALELKNALLEIQLDFYERFIRPSVSKRFQQQIYYVDKGLLLAPEDVKIPLLVKEKP